MRRHYQNPPLVEAVMELAAESSPSHPWTAAVEQELNAAFPEFANHERRLVTAGLQVQVNETGLQQALVQEPVRLQRWTQDKARCVHYGAGMCAHSVLGGYGHFEDHLPTAERLFATYLQVAKPKKITWAGQRFINIVNVPQGMTDPSVLFAVYPKLPRSLAAGHNAFAMQVETFREAGSSVVVNVAYQGQSPNGDAAYLIDVYARSELPVELDAGALMAWQKSIHPRVIDSFEMTITNEARQLFKEVTNAPSS